MLVGIWGMETSYGGFLGGDNSANILANMAAEGRRRKLGESELHAMMRLIASGKYKRADFKSSQAGAVGHTQFMPSNILKFGEDFDRDGLVNLWGSPSDALASSARYLNASGFVSGTPWGVEVELPDDFDYRLADGRKMAFSDWRALGVRSLRPAPNDLEGDLWVPTGATGPKFLLLPNFYTFKAYNLSLIHI